MDMLDETFRHTDFSGIGRFLQLNLYDHDQCAEEGHMCRSCSCAGDI